MKNNQLAINIKQMKKIIIQLTIMLLILNSCEKIERKNEEKKLIEHRETELSKNIRKDTIFLDFVFGMSENEFEKHLRKLIGQEKLKIDDLGYYYYTFNFGENEIPKSGKATFSPEYFENKLFKLSISVSSDELISSPLLTQLKLVSIYSDKYGFNYFREKSAITEEDNFIWIEGNREIELVAGISDARIFYTDLIAEKKSKISNETQAIENKKEIKNDI